MIQQMLNRMCTENHILKKRLGNQKAMTFFACLGFACYASIDNHTFWPLILLFGLYVFFKVKGKFNEKV